MHVIYLVSHTIYQVYITPSEIPFEKHVLLLGGSISGTGLFFLFLFLILVGGNTTAGSFDIQ